MGKEEFLMKRIRRLICSLLAVAMVLTLTLSMGNNLKTVQAASAITGNTTMGSAYNFGTWSSINDTAILYSGEQQSWFRFTVAAGEKIYVRVSSDTAYTGMEVELRSASGSSIGNSVKNPDNLINTTGLTPCLYMNIDTTTSSNSTYYLVVNRGGYYTGDMYFSLSAADRIRTGSRTVEMSGTASNMGNTPFSSSGRDSSVISINLSDSSQFPDKAIVTSITTSSTQSPSQGNVHHMIQPAKSSKWYTSTVSSATRGSYNISISDNIDVKQIWKFKYNAMATAKSTMRSVKLNIRYQYDLKDTGYRIFTN